MGRLSLSPRRFLDVRFDPTGRCNLRCKMCYYRYQKEPYPTLPFEKCLWIAQQFFPRARSLRLGNSAEALLYPQLPELLQQASQYQIPEIRFITNGTLLDQKKSELLMQHGVFAITVSMDAASDALFSELRCGADLSKVLGNLEALASLKRQKNSSLPRLQFNYVMMRSNLKELPDFIRLVARFKPVEINAYFAHLENGCPHEEEIIGTEHPDFPAVAAEAARLAEEFAIILHLPYFQASERQDGHPGRFSWIMNRLVRKMRNRPFRASVSAIRTLANLKLTEGRSLCWYPSMLCAVQPDLRIVPCCSWNDEGMGPVEGMTFDEIWNGQEWRNLRESLRTRTNLPRQCVNCAEATSRRFA